MKIARFDKKDRVVLTFGNFDGIHLGHSALLATVKEIASDRGLKSVLITFDPHTTMIVNPNLGDVAILDKEQKKSLITLAGIDCVDFISFTEEFSRMKAEDFIKDFILKYYNVSCIVVGPKCRFGKNCTGDIMLLRKCAAEVGLDLIITDIFKKGVNCYSSSNIRSYLKQGKIKLVNAILGRNYGIWGEVIHGEKRGRKIGFPTINVNLRGILKPKLGVYCGRVFYAENWLYGVINIGKRPTFDIVDMVILEMHIFDFNKEIYGAKVKFEIFDFIREEKKFDSVDALTNQIKQDIQISIKKHAVIPIKCY